jgi:hypothetical protein
LKKEFKTVKVEFKTVKVEFKTVKTEFGKQSKVNEIKLNKSK